MADAARQQTRTRNPRGHGDRLRGDVIAAAEDLLKEQPVEVLSLRAVARSAGVSATALYPHFADRRALVWSVLEHLFGVLTAETTRAAAQFDRPYDRLRAWCLTYCRFGLTHPGHYRVLFESWSAEQVEAPLTDLPGYELRRGLLALISDCSSDDVDELGTLIWAGLHGLVSLRINKPSFPWPPIETLLDALLMRMIPPTR
ncbi:TetR/AcrR family transcriptional regulator [Mycolicibacterium sphagni]|nr:TetR/AcrR family transcriptional regulator [Mycolicibacterium sphagni]MCV7175973.1 TetR/AcrR family transcriptional regulator [Mycolicibacterium sphagni]